MAIITIISYFCLWLQLHYTDIRGILMTKVYGIGLLLVSIRNAALYVLLYLLARGWGTLFFSNNRKTESNAWFWGLVLFILNLCVNIFVYHPSFLVTPKSATYLFLSLMKICLEGMTKDQCDFFFFFFGCTLFPFVFANKKHIHTNKHTHTHTHTHLLTNAQP